MRPDLVECKTKPLSAGHTERLLTHPIRPNRTEGSMKPTQVLSQPVRLCSVEGCGGRHKARGYCNRHYLQVVWHGGEPTPPRRYDTTVRDELGRKRCVSCETWRAESEFHKSKKCKDGYASTCSHCYRNQYTARYRHGLNDLEYSVLLDAQGGRCLCGADGPFVIDHDHSCCPGQHGCKKCVRGIICQPCNKTLGFSRDNAALLRRLADYLDSGGVAR